MSGAFSPSQNVVESRGSGMNQLAVLNELTRTRLKWIEHQERGRLFAVTAIARVICNCFINPRHNRYNPHLSLQGGSARGPRSKQMEIVPCDEAMATTGMSIFALCQCVVASLQCDIVLL